MIIPIRCFTCGNCIANNYLEYSKRVKEESENKVLDSLNYSRACCRRMFLGHVDLIDELLKYERHQPKTKSTKHQAKPRTEKETVFNL